MRQNQDVQMAPDKKRNFWKLLLLKDDFFNLVMMTRASMLSQQDNNVTMLQLQKKFLNVRVKIMAEVCRRFYSTGQRVKGDGQTVRG